MRRQEYEADPALGLELFTRAPTLDLAGTTEAGEVVLRTLHGVVDEGWACFHAAPVGEKTSLVGRPVVLSVEEEVARLPSTFFDAERACPATTLFRSAQATGVLRGIEAPERKARVLQALMEKLQPGGGAVPITADHPLYRGPVKGLLIAGLPLDRLSCKAKLAQNKSPVVRARLLEQLWERGLPGDPMAIELIREANPDTPLPGFLEAPPGLSLHVAPAPSWLEQIAGLIKDVYWVAGLPEHALIEAHRHSAAWVGLCSGRDLIGTARAISDRAREAWIFDVFVEGTRRNHGLGQVLMRTLLTHPAVRACRRIRLGTRDAVSLYRRFGFVDVETLRRPGTVDMVRAPR